MKWFIFVVSHVILLLEFCGISRKSPHIKLSFCGLSSTSHQLPSPQWLKHSSSPLRPLRPLFQPNPQLEDRWTACWGSCNQTWADKAFRRPPRETVRRVKSRLWDRWCDFSDLQKDDSWHKMCKMRYLLLVFAGGDSSGEGVAPRALCLHGVRDWTGQPQLLREGRSAVLRVWLLHTLLPPLRSLQ